MAKEITLNHITKIEGHAKLTLGINKGKVTKCELWATEGSRYFEGIVVNRNFKEASELTSRICGICSCAHVIAAIKACENACGYEPSEQTIKLRELLTLAERIRSHATHLYFLALPDYVGYESALAMAPKYKKELKIALRLMKVGNNMVKLIGGRDLHPVSATVGGWLKIPKQNELEEISKDLLQVKKDAIKTCELFFSLKYPKFKTVGEYFSLKDESYSMLFGNFYSREFDINPTDYRNYLIEGHEEYSNANFVSVNGKRFMVGALSRINHNGDKLSKDAKLMLKRSKIKIPSKNPFYQIHAQAIELVQSIDHSIEIISKLKIRHEKVEDVNPKSGIGVGAIEVPRGTLWHEYEIDHEGKIKRANIITPTAQNLCNMQEDIRDFVPQIIHKKKENIIMDVEKLIRAYDPCFSCSAHFLEVKWV